MVFLLCVLFVLFNPTRVKYANYENNLKLLNP